MGSARLALLALWCGACSPATTPPVPPGGGLVADENRRAGAEAWSVDDLGSDEAFGAYARPLSVTAGEQVDIQVNAGSARSARWEVLRVGHYGGAGARRVESSPRPIAIGPQPDPDLDGDTGRVECRWSTAFSLPITAEWLSGLYVVRVATDDGAGRFAPFVVRDDRAADVVVVLPTATDQAYNAWGGESLYSDTRYQFPFGHAYEVSYDRPLHVGAGAGSLLTDVAPALRYLEANGYDVTYLADHDVDAQPAALTRARLALTLAHDEYWSRTMRDRFEQARDGGVSLGFLGANTGYWQVRFAPAGDGMPRRRQIGYKEAVDLDPLRHVDDANTTGAFRKPPLDRPENALLGVMSVDWHMADFPWVVAPTSPSTAWLYDGTGLAPGDLIPGVVGVETDGRVDNGFEPMGLSVVAESPTLGGDHSGINRHQATLYPTAAGGFVFAAASIRFPATLSGVRGQRGAQRILANLIARAGGRPHVEVEQTVGAASGFGPADLSRAAARMTLLAGGVGQPGFVDGPGQEARFASPLGLAVAADGALLVADAGNHRLRRVATDPLHTVTTLAGSGAVGSSDGPAALASFETPWAIAVASDGAVLVTDPPTGAVRRVSPGGVVTTVAGRPTLSAPAGLAIGADGTLYVGDLLDGQIRTIDGAGVVRLLPVHPVDGGLAYPSALLIEGDRLWALSSGDHTLHRRDADGRLHRLAGSYEGGFVDGGADTARLAPVLGLARRRDVLLVGDSGNYRVRLVEPGPTAATTTLRTFATGLVIPTGIAVDAASGVVYVSESGNAVLRQLE